MVVAYTFGESDLYSSPSFLEPLLMWLVKRYGFVTPLFCGKWWCPLLPRDDVPLNTVIGEAIKLPRIEEPTREDVSAWHGLYVQRLTALFERHKTRFGLGERSLVLR